MNRSTAKAVIALARRFWTPRTGVIVHLVDADGARRHPKYRLCLPGSPQGEPGSAMVPGDGLLWADERLVSTGDLDAMLRSLGGVRRCLAYATNIYRSQDIPDSREMCLCLRGGATDRCAEGVCPLRRRRTDA